MLSESKRLRVLSVQARGMGHGTYASLLRQCVADSRCRVDSCWIDDERELRTRLINRVLSFSLPGRWAQQQNVDMRRFRLEMGLGLMGRRLVERKLGRTRYEVLHFHTQVGAYDSIRLMRRVPTVLTGDMTSAQIAREVTIPAFRWSHAPSIAREKQVFGAARRIAFWSNWAARSAVEEMGAGPEKVAVIHPGVDLDLLPPPDWKAPNEKKGKVKLLFVGTDFERKGGFDLLEVFPQFAAQAELHLMTGAALPSNCPGVHVHRGVRAYSSGWLDLFGGADIFVLPTHHEAFGLVFPEAMAAGLPVIATRINAIPEIVEHEASGILIEPGDRAALAGALRQLIESAGLRRKMGERGRKIVEQKFDARANFGKLERVFEKVHQEATT